MRWLPAVFSLLVMAAGWFYLFYSRAAGRLSGIEDQSLNARRLRVRRVGGLTMMLLGIAIFAGYYSVDPDRPTVEFGLIWLAVCVLVVVLVMLALFDMRLTWRLRGRSGRHDSR